VEWIVIRFALVWMVSMLAATAAVAEIGPGRAMISIGGSYYGGELESTGEIVHGTAMNLGLDVFHPTKPLSLLVAFSWGQMTRDDAEDGARVERAVRTWPTFIGGRYWLGPRWIKFSVGAAAGIWFAALDTNVDGVTVYSSGDEGFGFMFPLALSLSVTRGINLNASYAANLLVDGNYLKDDLIHSVNVSLGFSWGN